MKNKYEYYFVSGFVLLWFSIMLIARVSFVVDTFRNSIGLSTIYEPIIAGHSAIQDTKQMSVDAYLASRGDGLSSHRVEFDPSNPIGIPTSAIDLAFPVTPEDKYSDAILSGEVVGPSDKHITARSGVFKGPSGRETYYNLRMNTVVKHMRSIGYSEEEYPYWVREDGAKMLGNYVMVAANLSTRPKGTIIETSLGTAIVCDTGGFVNTYPNGVDIAVDWRS